MEPHGRPPARRRARAALVATLALFVGAWLAAGLPRHAPTVGDEALAYPCADHACGCTITSCSYEAGCCCYGPEALAAFRRPQREPDRAPTLRDRGCRRDGPTPVATVLLLSVVPTGDDERPTPPRARRVDPAPLAPRGATPAPEVPPPRADRLV